MVRLLLVGGDGARSGVPRHILDLCRDLAPGTAITVLSEPCRGGYEELKGLGAVHVTQNGLACRKGPLALWWAFRGHLRQAALHRRDGDGPQAVWLHAPLGVLLGRIGWCLGRLFPASGLPEIRIVTFHGIPFDPGHGALRRTLMRWIEVALLALCPPLHLVFLSAPALTGYRAAMGRVALARHRCHVLTNSTRLAPAPATPPGRHLVMTTRDAWQKNLDAAARLFAGLPYDSRLTLCGNGTDGAALRDRFARQLPPGAMARVRFLGQVADVAPVLAQADAYLMTSRYEGLPYGALEAFAMGLPLVLSEACAGDLAPVHPLCLTIDPLDPLSPDQVAGFLYRLSDLPPDTIRATIRKAWLGSPFAPDLWRSELGALCRRTGLYAGTRPAPVSRPSRRPRAAAQSTASM